MRIVDWIKYNWLNETWEYNLVLLLPIINGLATIFTVYFEGTILNPGVLRGVLVFFLFFYILGARIVNQNIAAKLIYITFLYFGVLVLFSSNVFVSLNVYLKFMAALIHLLLGMYCGFRKGFLKKLTFSFLIMITIFMIDFVLSNIFNYGGRSYDGVENVMNFGAIGVNLAKILSSFLLLVPIFLTHLNVRRNRILAYVLFLLVIAFILFAFKRSAILGLIIGSLILVVYYPNRGRVFKSVLIFTLIAVAASPLYIDQVIDNYNARKEAIDLNNVENLEKQARYLEYARVTDTWLSEGLSFKFFGAELFNDREFYHVRRMLHTDYMSILNGAGLIGLLLFVFLHVGVVYVFYLDYIQSKLALAKLYFAVAAAMIAALLFYGFAGTVYSVEPRASVFLFLGVMMSEIKRTRATLSLAKQ